MILLAELPMTSHGASLAKLMATQALEQFLMVGLCGGHAPFPLYPPLSKAFSQHRGKPRGTLQRNS